MVSEPWTHLVENAGSNQIVAIIVEDKSTLPA
jgi:hypothetical protein